MNQEKNKPVILQQYFEEQLNNGGPATGAKILLNSFLKYKYEFISMNKSFPFNGTNLNQFFYFVKTIKDYNPDIIHIRGIHSEGFFGVLAGKLLRKKVVLSVHGFYFDALKKYCIKRLLYKHFIEKFALKNADLVYCVCDYACQRDYLKKNTKHLYGFIHNAAPDYNTFISNNNKKEIRSKYGFNNDDLVISLIGRITKDKGFETLKKSIPNIIKINPYIKFIIGGEGPYLEEFKRDLIEYLNSKNVICLGKINNVPEVLFSSDIFLLLSKHENLSNALLEAATIGIPVIATNVGGNPEVITDGINGFLIQPNNPNELIEKVLVLANDLELRTAFAQRINTTIEEKFSQTIILNQISQMYDSLLTNKAK